MIVRGHRAFAAAALRPLTARRDHLQDCPTWLDNRFVDAVTVAAADVPAPAPMSRQGP